MKQPLRRAILAVSLFAVIAPAVAQAPPPVPALPDAERRTTYTLTAQTCACAVNFALYGDSTDYQNWVEVFINGVRVNYNDATYGWTITSPTGSLGLIPRPVTDAVLTFNNPQTGTVQIVGARRPRRVSQVQEGRGVAARDFNQAMSDLVAQNRETWDRTNDISGRAVLALPGETVGALPSASSRAGKFFTFDGSGNPSVTTPTLGTGNVTGSGSSTNGHVPAYSSTLGTAIQDSGFFPVQPSTCASHQYMSQIQTSGIPACAQPAISDLQNIGNMKVLGNVSGSSGPVAEILLSSISPTVSPSIYGAVCNGTTDDTTALNNMYAGIAAGSIVQFPASKCKTTGTINIGVSSTTNFPIGGGITSTATGNGFNITASNVAISCQLGATINGPRTPITGNTYLSGNTAIYAAGTAGAHIANIVVRGCTITNWQEGGIRQHYCDNCYAFNNNIQSVSYVAIEGYVCSYCLYEGNYINSVSSSNGPASSALPTNTKTNAYGISFTTDGLGNFSQHSIMSNNVVNLVPTWECYDIHAGQDIKIVNNICTNARVGIQVTTDGGTNSPNDVLVQGNFISCYPLNLPVYPGSSNISVGGAGIYIAGVAGGGNQATDITVHGNTVSGCGSSENAAATFGGINAGAVNNISISDNHLTGVRWRGILLYDQVIGSVTHNDFSSLTAGPLASGNILIQVGSATCGCLLSGNFGNSSGSEGYYITAQGGGYSVGIARDNQFFNLAALYDAGGPATNRIDLGASAP